MTEIIAHLAVKAGQQQTQHNNSKRSNRRPHTQTNSTLYRIWKKNT